MCQKLKTNLMAILVSFATSFDYYHCFAPKNGYSLPKEWLLLFLCRNDESYLNDLNNMKNV